jgi:preprotein translocase subunit SecG
MNSVVDTIMLLLFLFFMVFIFGGYHKTKSQEREAFKEREESNNEQDSSD